MAWLSYDQLSIAAGVKQPLDLARVSRAATVACAKVRSLCGPVHPEEAIVERVRGGSHELALRYRPASLTSIAIYRSGAALAVGDFDFDGQVLYRVDGAMIAEDLSVGYAAGYELTDDIPPELTEMAILIGMQLLRVGRRFSLNGEATDLAATGFAVPQSALDIAEDYLLAPGGFA